MGKEEIENFPLREIKSFLKRLFSLHLTCKVIYRSNLFLRRISNPPGRLAGLRSWKHSRFCCGYKKDMPSCFTAKGHTLSFHL